MSKTPSENRLAAQAKFVPDQSVDHLPASSPPRRRWFQLRRPIHPLAAAALGIACIAICFCAWWFLTRGEVGARRLISPLALPSLGETIEKLPSLWVDRKLPENIYVTLRRLAQGFGLAALVGVPLGVVAGCFPAAHAFLTPLILFGRNIPLAALIPLMFLFFGIEEPQKIMFIFFACVAFVVSDSASNIKAVGQEYIDTAYTLGAKRRQVICKVLVPLALPAICDSLRLLFGLAFGYIMLAETVKFAGEEGGLGNLILMSQRRNIPAHIYLIILIVPLIALAIDRGLYGIQRQLFPHRFGGSGYLYVVVKFLAHAGQRITGILFRPDPAIQAMVDQQLASIATLDPSGLAGGKEHISELDQANWRP